MASIANLTVKDDGSLGGNLATLMVTPRSRSSRTVAR